MSYRAFKRLLGETSLERKCHFLFGMATMLLIAASFWVYAWYTEDVAYQQAEAAARLVTVHALTKAHVRAKLPTDWQALLDTLPRDYLPDDAEFDDEIITHQTKNDEKQKIFQQVKQQNTTDVFLGPNSTSDRMYYFALRANRACLKCHQALQPDLQENDLLGIASIKLPNKELENSIHRNRALLISTAFVSALLLMAGSYLIVRYVIVKPVKHLKEVSDAISHGQLNIRSEIQTGDEFEDLSHAFNRMLRHLVSMQDQLRKVNSDLDNKVDELAQANMALYSSYQLKSDFLATMSHELRTPLNSILGFSDLLLSQSLSEKQRKWVENIHGSGKHLLGLINDILDLAKMEAGKMQVRVEEFSVRDVCEGLMAMFRPQADQKKIQLESKVDPGLPPVHQDPNKLQQILWNLLSNAVKFTPEGGRVVLSAETDGVHILLAVTDTGVGIAEEDQEIIFEKFRQGSSTLTREHAGTGLGLSIVREMAKLLGGDVRIKSELGRGSTFTISLPLHLNADAKLAGALLPPPTLPSPRDSLLFSTNVSH